MGSGEDFHDVGQHLLGRHVVGQRVVIRRLLRGETGPTGGPAFTDVLGVCTSWGERTCVVAPESGSEVVIEIADIVSGKPVPPRPSVRHRVSALAAERHARVLWPGVEREPLGDWELRNGPGLELRRANSCLAIGDPERPFEAAVEAIEEFYAERDRPAMVQVETGSEQDEAFLTAGWEVVPGGDSHFQLAATARVARALRATEAADTTFDLTADGPRCTLIVRGSGGVPVARASAGHSGDWLGLHGFSVVPELRRRGLARRMLAELVEWGAERGATTVWLHVEVDNMPALGLYGSVGFTTHHSLRYLSCGRARTG